MPIKVRCPDCSTVMGVPDKAAGRAVKCKGCGGRVPVPAAGGQKRGVKKKKKKKRPAPPPEPSFDDDDYGAGGYDDDYGSGGGGFDDDVFGGLDLGRAEDSRQTVCPKCARKVDDEDIECPHCGVNIETGGLSDDQKRRKARKGPPPEEFYGEVWSNGWDFLMNHKGYAVKTGLNWGFSLAMCILAAYVLAWYIPGRTQELIDSADGMEVVRGQKVIIAPEDSDVIKYDNVKYGKGSTRLTEGRLELPPPDVAAMFSPPTYFWTFILVIFLLGCGGWAWTLSGEIVRLTMSRQKKIKRFHGDVFKNMMKGFTSIFWPTVLMAPVSWIPSVMLAAGADQMVCSYISLGIFLIPIVVFLPIAVVHMAQPYTYRAWLINWMGKDLLNTFAPTAFVSAMFFGLVLLLPLGLIAGAVFGWEQLSDFYMNRIEIPAINAVFSNPDMEGGFVFTFGRMPILFTVAFLTCTTISMIIAFPAVFMMRVFGLFGLYFRPDLELCHEQPPLSNAGFGPRYLAYMVDSILMACIALACFVCGIVISKVFAMAYQSPAVEQPFLIGSTIVLTISALVFYFSRWESGAGRATLGKWSLGLIVVQEDNEPMDIKLAIKRTFCASLSGILGYIPFVICAFNSQHRAMHDNMTKTKVVWRGDEDM